MNRGGSDEDEEDESEGPGSGNASKRNSLNLSSGGKAPAFLADEKTPTAVTLLSQAQATQRPASTFPVQAPIRRHTGQEGLPVPSQPSPSGSVPPSVAMMSGNTNPSVRHLPSFPSIDEAVGANSTTSQSIAAREVWTWFQDHLDALLESVRAFRFDQFEMHLRSFWSSLTGAHREVVHAPAVAGLMARADAIVYDVRFSDGSGGGVKLTITAGNSRAAPVTDALAHLARVVGGPSPTSRQDGEDTPCGSRLVREHVCRAQGRVGRAVRSSCL